MNLHEEAPESPSVDPGADDDIEEGVFFILQDIFDRIYPVVLALGGFALAVSLGQTLIGQGPYGFFIAQLLLYLGVVAVTLLRHRLSSRTVFSLFLSVVYAFAVASLLNRGLSGSGTIHVIFFCVLAGIYFNLRKAMTILAAAVMTMLLMAVGVCSGLFATRPDSAAYLFHPVNWFLQTACIVLYSVPLILSMNGFLQKIVDSRAALRGTNLRLTAEMAVRQETEARLRESEEKYRKIFENAVEGIFQISGDWRLISANPALAHMMGYDTPAELIAVNADVKPRDCVYGGDLTGLAKLMEEQGVVIGHEIRLHRKDGSLVWVSVNGRTICSTDGKVLCYEGALDDITSRKEAQQALIESEANYRSIVESSVAGFFTIENNIFRFVNRRACEITGYGYDEIVNVMKFIEPIHPDDQGTVVELVARCLAENGEIIPFDARVVCRNGRIITARFLIGRTLLNNAPAFSGTFIDMTRERFLEAQLRQAQKMQVVGQLAGGIAHDFNNILTVFSGYGRLLQMKTPQEDPRRNYVDQILSAARKAADLTQNLLTFSRQQPMALVPVEINRQIRETEKLLRRLLTEDIAFTFHLSGEPVTTLADATQIDRILFNLVTNARDAMPQGGRLRLETGLAVLDEDFREYHGFGRPGRYACISLVDTGIGMDRATLAQIFDPFFTTKEPGQGTGLGLATVYAIVKQHDGYITAESKPGQGTTFRIYFPAIRVATPERETGLPEILPGGRETILIADDNEDVRAFMRDVFSLAGYRTIEAADGEEAVCRFREAPAVDLVILDTVMPKMNGREAFEAMKKDNPSLKFLFISGYARNVILNKGVLEQEFNFLSKPLTPSTLLARAREVLDRESRP